MNAPKQIHMTEIIPRPGFMSRWEYQRHHRVHLAVQCFAEFVAVFLYVYMGVGSTASFIIDNLAAQPGVGTLFQVGMAYGIGVVVALVVCASTSGGHFSPCVTLVQAAFRGFPWKKVPAYIVSQILGAYVACFVVYLSYKDTVKALEAALIEKGVFDQIFFTANGPAGIFAIYPTVGKPLGLIFWNEFIGGLVIGLTIWAILDPTNFFAPPAAGPWIVGLAYAAAIWGFAPATVALNTARDLGGRLMAITVWGTRASGGNYAAIAALTNILAMFVAVIVYEFCFADSSRVLPQAQQQFLAGHTAHLTHVQTSNKEDYYHRRAAGSSSHDGSHESDPEKARVEMHE